MMNYFSKLDRFTMSEMQIEICISFHHDCVLNIIPPPPVSEPDPRKIEKEGLAHRPGWKCTLRPV